MTFWQQLPRALVGGVLIAITAPLAIAVFLVCLGVRSGLAIRDEFTEWI